MRDTMTEAQFVTRAKAKIRARNLRLRSASKDRLMKRLGLAK